MLLCKSKFSDDFVESSKDDSIQTIFDREQSLCGLTFMNVGMKMMMTFVKILLTSLKFVTGYDWL